MISKVILQPAGNKDAKRHFVDTIENPVAIERIKSHLTSSQRAELSPIFEGRSTIAVWGVTPGVNQKKWTRIEEGDVTLFSRQGHIFASATVIEKIHNKALAMDLWQTDAKGKTWEYIYFLDEHTEQKISRAELNSVVGYKERASIQAFNVLDEKKAIC